MMILFAEGVDGGAGVGAGVGAGAGLGAGDGVGAAQPDVVGISKSARIRMRQLSNVTKCLILK